MRAEETGNLEVLGILGGAYEQLGSRQQLGSVMPLGVLARLGHVTEIVRNTPCVHRAIAADKEAAKEQADDLWKLAHCVC